MKKILTAMAALAMVAGFASCQKGNDSVNGSSENGFNKVTVKASMPEASKVTYSENGDNALTPAWEENDKILVINNDNSASMLDVTEINGNVATLEGEAKDGLAHLVYMEGVNNSSWVSNKIEFSYDNQSGDNDMPAVMLADGTISNGSGEFMFNNAGAVIGIYNAKGVPASSAITKVTVTGSNLSKATISINDDALKLTATEKADDAISTETLSGITADATEDRALNSPIFIAVPAGAKIAKVTLTVGADTYTYTLAAEKTCNANDYLYIKTKEFKTEGPIMVGSTVYNDVVAAVEAINNATSPVTAKFLKDVTLQDAIIITNTAAEITLDLNGKFILAPDKKVPALMIQGPMSVVNIIDSNGSGKIDHTYNNTATTVVVDGGTLNLISGNICNTTGTGYGRVAVNVSAQKYAATFNVKGGAVIGGRGILVGSGNRDKLSSLYVYDGLVQGTTTSNGKYPAIGNNDYDGYAHVEVLGGTVMTTGSKAKSVIHIKKYSEVDVIIGGAEGKTPYLFNAMKNALVTGSNADCEATYTIRDFYGNIDKNTDEETEVFGGCDIIPVNPPIVDAYGNSYGFRIKEK